MSFKLSKLFTIAYFAPLIGVLGLFLYWQYSTIKEFHQAELHNYFTQTNKIVNILIKKEKKEIRDIILSNIKNYTNKDNKQLINLNNIDFVFATKQNKIINIEGYSLLADVEKLANKLKDLNDLNDVVSINLDNKKFFLVIHKEKIIDKSFGKVIGELWGATILNGNVTILKELKEDTGVDNLSIIDNDYNIIASTLEKQQMKNLIQQKRDKNIFISFNKKYIVGKNILFDYDNCKLNTVFIINNGKYNDIFDKFITKVSFTVGLLVLFGLIFYMIIRMNFINKLLDLKYFIQSNLQNKKSTYKSSSIYELDTIALEFEQLFSSFQKHQDDLEDTIKYKTQQNIKQLEVLQQQSKMAQMGEMIGAIAHQWRQPLNEISTGIQNLKYYYKDGSLNDEKFIKNFIDENKKTIKFMSRTIDDFRSFFRTDKEKKDFKVKETIQSVVDMQSSQLKNNNITLNIIGDEFIYCGLQGEFQQVILNIINNAKDALVDAAKRNSEGQNKIQNPTIDITLKDKTISIKDNAGGVPKDILDRIFEPYFTTKEQGKGTGIGLYMSKMIIEDNMGATLKVKNICDKSDSTSCHDDGACFIIILGSY